MNEAIDSFQQAIAIAKEIGDKRMQGMHMGNLGRLYRELSEYGLSNKHFDQAIAIFREIGDQRNEGIHLGEQGIVLNIVNQLDPAVTHFNMAIAIFREIGDPMNEGIYLGNQGDVLFKLRRYEAAESAFSAAISIGDRTFPLAAGAFRGSLALLLAEKDQLDEAQRMLQAGEPQVEKYPEEYAKFLCKKGRVFHMAGEVEKARAILIQAQAVASELNPANESEVAQALIAFADLLGEVATNDVETSGNGGR